MLRKLFAVLLGVLSVAAVSTVRAVPISDPPAADRGATTTAMADFGIAGPGSFDLWLRVPTGFKLVSIYDNPSDGASSAGYQRYTGGVLNSSTGYTGGSLESPGSANSATFNASGDLGVRVTDFSGGTQGFAKIKLDFELLSSAPFGPNPVDYLYKLNNGSVLNGVFNIRVNAPASGSIPASGIGLLLLSGLGALAAVKRRCST